MITKRSAVKLQGLVPLMFDRYAGDNQTTLPPEKKMYFAEDNETLILPSANLMSFLTAENTKSAPKIIFDAREYKDKCSAIAAFVTIKPFEIPITSNGVPVRFHGWDSQIQLHESVARLNKGVPNPKKRPVLSTPWELGFELIYVENDKVPLRMLQDIFMEGGLRVGLGTFRPVYGKFEVASWDELK